MLDHGFKFKPSKKYLSLLFTAFIASIGIVLYVTLSVLLKLIVIFFVIIYVGYIIWRYGFLKSKHAVISIRRDSGCNWYLQTKNTIYPAELCGDSVVTTFMSILRFRVPDSVWPISCIIFRDSLDGDAYRQLLVILKTGRGYA